MATRISRRAFVGMVPGGALALLSAAVLGAPGTRARAASAGRTDFPAIVVGSGFGGSVAALRLGRAGVETLVLERGRQWPVSPWKQVFGSQERVDGRMFWYRGQARWPFTESRQLRRGPGVMEVSEESGLDIACGAAVGGGSVVCTGVVVAPPRKYFEALYPRGLSYDEMAATWFPRASALLRASRMPSDVYASAPFTHARVWDQQMVRAGFRPRPLESLFDWRVVRQELAGRVRPSAIAGETDFGCGNGAKQSLDRTCLPAALATGHVRLRPLSEVRSVGRRHRDGRWVLEVRQHTEDGRVADTVEYTCERLFVCAGTLNTNRLLVAARDTGALPDLPAALGAGFGDNGDQFSARTYLGPSGPSQGAPSASTAFFDSRFGLPLRVENWQLLTLRDKPAVVTLAMTADLEHRGVFRYDPVLKRVRLADWSASRSEAAAAAMTAYNDTVAAASPATLPLAYTEPLTAHPVGGCAIGRCTDLEGRVHGYRNLYVLDASLIPGSVGGANPSLTVTALAERAMATIIARSG
ncbi:GMC oxidoreductase [Streptomyces netropsis]|uniref:GMC oxidoreductase n=1 Tax=Streptomyces netropsis TaxID=55404 RepID=UPI0037A22FD5